MCCVDQVNSGVKRHCKFILGHDVHFAEVLGYVDALFVEGTHASGFHRGPEDTLVGADIDAVDLGARAELVVLQDTPLVGVGV